MKVKYTKELNQTKLNISLDVQYEKDYQAMMMENNKIVGLLTMHCINIEGKSHFSYNVSGMKSMKKYYEANKFREQDILNFTEVLLQTIKEIRRYMLHPDGLLLHPSYIFNQDGQWYFVYLPNRRWAMDKAFHEMTEYFVRTLDYEEQDGIRLAYELHKETMRENYNLERILQVHKEQQKENRQQEENSRQEDCQQEEHHRREEHRRKETKRERRKEVATVQSISDDKKWQVADEQEGGNIFTIEEDLLAVCEKPTPYRPFRMVGERLRRGRWGNWDDLIVDVDNVDRQEVSRAL